MAGKTTVRRKRIKIKVPEKCYFCDNKLEPNFREIEHLKKFVTDRAKIMGRDRTGVCSRHQRKLSKEVKRARHLGLLSFVESI